MPPNPQEQKIQIVSLFPSDLDLDPNRSDILFLVGNYQRVFSLLHGLVQDQETETEDHSKVIGATEEGALLAAAYGVGFRTYLAASGNAPALATKIIYRADDGFLQRFDLLIETNSAVINFAIGRIGGIGGDIKLLPGFYSIPFVSRELYIKNFGAGVAVYNAVGYY